MVKLYYCANCKKIHDNPTKCVACENDRIKELTIGTPVNVIGTKTKGNVHKIREGEVELRVINPESREKSIKKYKHDEIRKVL
ncbi:hypothetical protein [Vallitalea okinawensis]|uniref:hypothetical protein n=1 Tax=Vallitalea okinawensis TaxID=2078660 RepID=UPI000CFA895B|nr:hypothetical protein [Vallitalea okinawensis]